VPEDTAFTHADPHAEELVMPAKKVKTFLDDHEIRYITINHSTAYTAQEVAALTHIKGKELAKTVIVKIDGTMAMAVVPASYRVDISRLRAVTGATDIELATEEEFKGMFPECDAGAMPPFGNLYDMKVYVAQSLADDESIAFAAGSHSEVIRLAFADFERLVKPRILQFSTKG
jgi:Ala-tRNA(Pro) deacylase